MNFKHLKEVKNDLFGILYRLKKIHSGYKIFWDKKDKKFVVFDGREFAFSANHKLDKSVLDKSQRTNVRFAKKIVADIDRTNATLEKKASDNISAKSKLLLSERLMYLEKTKRDCDFSECDTTRWI